MLLLLQLMAQDPARFEDEDEDYEEEEEAGEEAAAGGGSQPAVNGVSR
jgi:hypothetical protein